MAGRDHAIGVAVAAIAGEADGALDAVIGVAVGPAKRNGVVVKQRRRRRGASQGRVASRCLAGAVGVARPLAPSPAKALAGEGLRHHAEHRLAVLEKADQHAPERQPGDEGAGAVDRVEHPDEFGVGALAAILLADDAVLRIGRSPISLRIAASAARSAAVTGSKPAAALVLDRSRVPEIAAGSQPAAASARNREMRAREPLSITNTGAYQLCSHLQVATLSYGLKNCAYAVLKCQIF